MGKKLLDLKVHGYFSFASGTVTGLIIFWLFNFTASKFSEETLDRFDALGDALGSFALLLSAISVLASLYQIKIQQEEYQAKQKESIGLAAFSSLLQLTDSISEFHLVNKAGENVKFNFQEFVFSARPDFLNDIDFVTYGKPKQDILPDILSCSKNTQTVHACAALLKLCIENSESLKKTLESTSLALQSRKHPVFSN
jgi:hypothetical protein